MIKYKVTSASFIKSAKSINDSIENFNSEIVFLGRSNVGKSSIINSLLNKKGLAKSSSTPGKTRLINFFDTKFEDSDKNVFDFVFVDLPGFGYAKVDKGTKKEWQENLGVYLSRRRNIKLFVFLRDSRHMDLKIDEEIKSELEMIKKGDQKILTVYTKSDKLTKNELNSKMRKVKDSLFISNLNKDNIEYLRDNIVDLALGINIDNN